MNLEKEFKNYVKDFADKIEYDISNDELETLYKGFFDKNVGIINFMISSRIQDFMYEKQHTISKDNELEK